MEIVYPRCAGLDLHKKSVMVCRVVVGEDHRRKQEVRSFGTMTRDILALGDWLAEAGVTHVAMESTGVYWKPIWNLLEGRFHLLLINARHIRQVPGRKTDVKDCEWIAQLLQHGLLRGSFVPTTSIRELRDLTRMRATLVDEKSRITNRIHKTLEDANIKLGSVATDILGVSGREMLQAIVEGEESPGKLADLARRRLRAKLPELRLALDGRVTAHHRFLLHKLLEHLRFLEKEIVDLDARIQEVSRPFHAAVRRLVTMPGFQQRTAENLVAEVGPDMAPFPTSAHVASWTGVCPGNNESAGKRRSGRTPKGNRWLRRTLGEAAWAASRTKGTYAQAQYRRLAARRGKKRAIVAVGHGLLVAAYHILKHNLTYQDLGANHFDKLDPDRLTHYLVRRLNKLGHKVTLEPLEEVA